MIASERMVKARIGTKKRLAQTEDGEQVTLLGVRCGGCKRYISDLYYLVCPGCSDHQVIGLLPDMVGMPCPVKVECPICRVGNEVA